MMITVNEATKAFGDHLALDHLSLQVAKGECVALLGPNGAGKSTLLKTIGGLIRLDSGQISISGQSAHGLVGMVPQRTAFPPRRTPRELLSGLAYLHGLDAQAADAALVTAGLEHASDRHIGGFSGGMQQRLAIAQALLGDPPVLLLDEPSTGLDPAATRDFLRFLARLRQAGKTMLISTHHLEETRSIADRAAILYAGKVVSRVSCDADLAESYLDAIARAQEAA